MWEFLYERSVGCVGILKEWLVRACVRSIRHGDTSLTRQHLETTALSISQCEKILAESRGGETRLNDTEDSKLRFRTLLGIESQTVAAAQAPPVPSANRKNVRLGQRNPHRDPIREKGTAVYA